MPTHPNKPCLYPGCKNLVKKGYCKDHDEFNTDKFRNQRNGVHPWYQLRIWKDLRLLKLKRDPICEYCKARNQLTPATVVDHHIPWKTGRTKDDQWRLFTEYNNLKSSCKYCHNSKTAKENK